MIRDGFSQDAGKVFALIESVYKSTDAFAADFEQEYPSPGALEARLANIRSRPGRLFLVACHEDELLGYLFVVPRTANRLRHTADLNMGVRQAARGRGIGAELLTAALTRLRSERIIELVYLMARADNTPALKLYKRHGFAELATLVQDIKTESGYHDGILMRLQIGDLPLPSINPAGT